MPLFLVRRHFPRATRADLDAASFRSLSCLMYHPGLAWIRSYWNAATETLTCVYQAEDEGQIRAHASRAAIPCQEISRVDEVDPAQYVAETPPAPENATAVTDRA